MPTSINHYSLSLLRNFLSDLDQIILTDNLKIVRLDQISNPEARILIGENGLSKVREITTFATKILASGQKIDIGELHFVPHHQVGEGSTYGRVAELSNHAIEWRHEGEVSDPFNTNYDRFSHTHLFSKVLSALRLMKPDFVGRYPAFSIIKGDPSRIEGPYQADPAIRLDSPPLTPSSVGWLTEINDPFRLSREEIDYFKKLFQAVTSVPNSSRINIALNRLNSLYVREEEIDKLIDVIIAFESLYSSGPGSGNLKFRLAARVARHLGGKPQDRQSIYDEISTAYELRNDIVHGNKDISECNNFLQKKGWSSLPQFIFQLTYFLRMSLQRILLHVGVESFKKDFHTKLDSSLISGSELIL